MRSHDWSSNPLGDPTGWAPELKTLVSVMLGSAHPMFIAWGPGRVMLYNDGYAPMCGMKHPWALGRSFNAVWADILEDVLPILERAYAGVSTHMPDLPLRMLDRRGYPEDTHFSFSYTPVRDERGQVAGMFCACVEITDQVARRTNEERWRGMVAQASAGIAETDLDGRFTFANTRFAAITGRSIEELLTLTMREITYVDDLRRCVERFERTVRNGTPYRIEKRYVRADGSRVWVNNEVYAIRDARGKPHRIVALAVDITERKWAEDRLRESEARARWLLACEQRRARQLQEMAQMSVALSDARSVQSTLEHITEAARLIIGAHQSVTSRTIDGDWSHAITALSLSEKYAGWRPYGATPDGSGIYSIVCETNGPMRLTQAELEAHPRWRAFGSSVAEHPPIRGWLAAPLIARDGTNRGLIQLSDKFEGDFDASDTAILVQIAQLASAAIEQAESDQVLREADRRKDEFLAVLAHELRNPLAPLRNGVQIARVTAPTGSPLQQTVQMMDRQLTHLVRLVDDLLDVSRISRGKVELRRRRVTLNDIIANSVESVASVIEAHGHELIVDMGTNPLELEGDFERLAQVFSNLLSNAAKYTEDGGHIRVVLEAEADEAIVSVSDTGIGIPADDLEQVFDLFSQVRLHQGRAEGGLGIGLALVRSLVKMHGGSVVARSAGTGHGSAFIVRLPLLGAPTAERDEVAASCACVTPRLRILVADDNVDSAASLAMLLEFEGHDVATANDGAEAVEKAAVFAPEVVFLDLGMPGVDGIEAARRIRALPHGRQALLVALTGWGQAGDRERTEAAGFDHHLVKPVDPAILAGVMSGR